MNDHPIGRRTFFFLGTLGLSACSYKKQALTEHRVSIRRAAGYDQDLALMMRQILLDHRVVIAGKNVVLKPNMVEFDAHRPINTHARFVAAAAEAFVTLGARSVRIAEGPGHRRETLEMAEAAGYFRHISCFETRFTDLNLDEVS